jgi:hypothetical protein
MRSGGEVKELGGVKGVIGDWQTGERRGVESACRAVGLAKAGDGGGRQRFANSK